MASTTTPTTTTTTTTWSSGPKDNKPIYLQDGSVIFPNTQVIDDLDPITRPALEKFITDYLAIRQQASSVFVVAPRQMDPPLTSGDDIRLNTPVRLTVDKIRQITPKERTERKNN